MTARIQRRDDVRLDTDRVAEARKRADDRARTAYVPAGSEAPAAEPTTHRTDADPVEAAKRRAAARNANAYKETGR